MVNAKLHMMKAWVLIGQFPGNVICYNITGKKKSMQKKNLSIKKSFIFNSDDAFYCGFQKNITHYFQQQPFSGLLLNG